MAIEIVDFPMKSGDFPIRFLYVYQRVCHEHDICVEYIAAPLVIVFACFFNAISIVIGLISQLLETTYNPMVRENLKCTQKDLFLGPRVSPGGVWESGRKPRC